MRIRAEADHLATHIHISYPMFDAVIPETPTLANIHVQATRLALLHA
jgi:hypothetical protein